MRARTLGSLLAFALLLGSLHCGSDPTPAAPPQGDGDAGGATPPGSFGNQAEAGAGDDCVPPDILITLDRTLTMHKRPDGTTPPDTVAGRKESKWSMAIEALKTATAPPLDQNVRFGLELWPRLQDQCVTLSQRLGGTGGGDPPYEACAHAEVLVSPALGASAAIAAELDPNTTKICSSTPTGTALLDAKATLESIREEGRPQFVYLVTDGVDFDVSCPLPDPVAAVDDLMRAGIKTVMVSFTAEPGAVQGPDRDFLNDVACAGGTAKGFPAGCELVGDVYRSVRGGTDDLFVNATNGEELVGAISSFAKTVCCGCVK